MPGQKLPLQSIAAQVDPLLTSISVAHLQSVDDFVAHRAFPVVPVTSQQGKYWQFSKDDMLRYEAQKRSPGTPAALKQLGSAMLTYYAEEYALDMALPDEERDQEGAAIDEQTLAVALTQDLLMKREADFASAYMGTSGVWDNYKDGSSDFTQWDAAGATIAADVRSWKNAVKTASGLWPTKMVVSKDVHDVIVEDADILDRVKYTAGITDPARVTMQALAAIFELDEYLVMQAMNNTAAEGATFSGSFFVTERVGLFHAPRNPSLRTPSAGYTFSWRAYDNVNAEVARSGAAGMHRYRDEREEATYLRGKMFYEQAVVASSCGLVAHDVLS